jgi:Holliday junction resolvase RusA-like endonuclease
VRGISFTVPGEPRGWARARTQGARFFTDSKTASEKQAVAAWALQAGAQILVGPVDVRLSAYLRIPQYVSKKRRENMMAGIERPTKKPDADNLAKLALDALNGVCWVDDVQVVDLTVRKFWSYEPRLVVEISPVLGITEQAVEACELRPSGHE